MRILAIASASGGCAAAIVADGAIEGSFHLDAEHGLPERVPLAIEGLLAIGGPPDLVAVVVGPGSFTGLRAGIAAAQGVALGAGVPVVGVTVTEALAEAVPGLGDRALWVASAARTGRVFIDRHGEIAAFAEAALPPASGRIAVAGDAAPRVAAALAARGVDTVLTGPRTPLPVHVAAVGARRAAGLLPPLAAVPLYVDAPEAKLPAGGLRPPPS